MRVFSLSRRLAAEGLGTALLLMAVVGSGIMAERLAGAHSALALLANTLSTGAALVVLISVFGPVSGAHLNPVVTLYFALRRQILPWHASTYVLVQIVCAFIGVLVAHAMFDMKLFEISHRLREGPGQWLAEAIASFGLVLTIAGASQFRPTAVAGLVGLYISAAYWFTASTSFANPAVTLARVFTDSFCGIAPASAPGFIAAQLLGALLAWLFCVWMFDGASGEKIAD